MKYLLSIGTACLLMSASYAQKGFYIAPYAGAGTGNIFASYIIDDHNGHYTSRHTSGILSNSFRAGIGYRYKNWYFESGIQYMTSGYEMEDLVFVLTSDPVTGVTTIPGSERTRQMHIGIPLQTGYHIPLCRKLTLVPGVGILTNYMLGASSETRIDNVTSKKNWAKESLDNYGRFSVWGLASLQLEYKIDRRSSLIGGPGLQYKPGNNNAYTLQLNLGIRIGV